MNNKRDMDKQFKTLIVKKLHDEWRRLNIKGLYKMLKEKVDRKAP